MRKVQARTLSYRHLSSRFLNRVTHATRQEQWGRSLLQLAWTTGPVTFLALHGGYFFGFGHAPPEHLFYYFGGYTLVTGVVSIATRFVYNLTRGRSLQRAEQAMQTVMGGLPLLVASCRNATISFYEPEYRPTITAQYILSNPDASIEAVRTAVDLLTGDTRLAEAAGKSEIFRRQGLSSLSRESAEQVRKPLQKACSQVNEISPELSRLLYERLHGRVISKRIGLPRTQGFLYRGLKAIEYDDPARMNLSDTIETATLLFELLAGREFPRIELRYKGARYISEAGERMERARRALRAAVNRRNSRLWSLGEHLRSRRSMKRFAAAVHAIHTPRTWNEEIEGAVQELVREIGKHPAGRDQQFARKALQKLRDLEKAEQQMRRLERDLVKAQLGYQQARRRLDRRYGENTAPVILRDGQRLRRRDHVGIELVKRGIVLHKAQQRDMAVRLAPIVDKVEGAAHDPAQLVKIGYELMKILEQALPIYRWSVQSAFERSNAPDLAQLEQGLTTATRIGWGLSLVRELRTNYSELIHAAARALVDYHRIELDEDAIEYLVEEYGANRVYLEALAPSEDEQLTPPDETREWPLKAAAFELQQALHRPERTVRTPRNPIRRSVQRGGNQS
ncbi:hypothetical protein [Spirochaeta africana]|uniref:Uncharacterized protein n=1 Tax=Spirochaeta africana (strain ATCC 700263 / DSM 8902 / Z-7692) TaxID=889378 RepID=H9UIQ8_SPIAZ|nr:hypothetical protein [Spirochaeta africana]AFG37401.1 hypothetical protein Spiaf_1327 [Spirochaeta africana DSM 8902]